jgi:hypothetical protein
LTREGEKEGEEDENVDGTFVQPLLDNKSSECIFNSESMHTVA